ncbi:MAG: hypothetical protein BRD55_06785 [Bacteroidetes bacterium SW_9_63_38]|nr:MAG: hypothetical protein BRD55_06785 [Bacteroidetes bacterium SW_9_63_38]
MYRAVVFLVVVGLVGGLAAPEVHGQSLSSGERSGPVRIGSVNFNVGVPVGPFADNIESAGFGGNLFLGTQLGASPAVLGLDLGFLIYGRSERTVLFSRTVGPSVNVDVITTNNIFQPHAVFQLQPLQGPFRPYVEAVGGFKYLFTRTRIEDRGGSNDADDDIASETNFDDFAWSGGGGAGVDIIVYRPREGKRAQSSFRELSVHFGGQYLSGQEAEYLAEGTLQDENDNLRLDKSELDIRRSTTNLVVIKIGLTAYF